MSESRRFAGVEGLVVEASEWLPSDGADAGLLRVRGRWAEGAGAGGALPELHIGSGAEARRFESLPDARFARDPSAWRGTYLVPPELMRRSASALWLAWPGGEEVALPAPDVSGGADAGAQVAGAAPGAVTPGRDGQSRAADAVTPARDTAPAADPSPVRGGEVIDRAVLAERRARRAEAAERSQARRADEALKAVEVLELRSAELERRLARLQTAAPAPEKEPGGDAAQAALSAALASLAQLRRAAHDQRLRLRASELQRSADAVALATLQSDPESTVRLREALRERHGELDAALERAASAEAAVVEARRQAGEQVAAASRRAAADASAVRERVRADLDAARDEAESVRAEARAMRTRLAAATDDLDAERAAHAEARARLAAREAELQAIAAELAGVRADLEAAVARGGELEQQLAELDATVATERDGRLAAATALVTAHSRLAAAEAGHRAESVARAVLEEQLDRERTAREALTAAVERIDDADRPGPSPDDALTAALEDAARSRTAARAAETALRELEGRNVSLDTALAEERAARVAAEAALRDERTARIAAESALAEERAARVAADAAPDAHSSTAAAAAGAAVGLQARIAEIERTASSENLDQRAADQAAAAAASQAAPEHAGRLSADLDAAAAALRARTAPAEIPAADEPATGEHSAMADATADDGVAVAMPNDSPAGADLSPDDGAGVVSDDGLAVADVSSDDGAVDAGRQVPSAARVSVPRAALSVPAHAGVPVLRGALVKMAHEDPGSAARLLLALLPALRAIVATPLDFDLTIRGTGTYAVTLGADTWSVLRVAQPRSRTVATCHVAADVATLAELVAGADKRLGRWLRPVRVKGRRNDAEALAAGVRTATLSLPEAVRAGASPPPDLVFRAFAHVIDPAWTRGHRFSVAQHVTGPAPTTMHVLVRDGAPVVIQRWAPPGGPDATVTMSPAAYDGLLRAEPLRAGDRPVVRGNRHAVALLKTWTDRAQGLGA